MDNNLDFIFLDDFFYVEDNILRKFDISFLSRKVQHHNYLLISNVYFLFYKHKRTIKPSKRFLSSLFIANEHNIQPAVTVSSLFIY